MSYYVHWKRERKDRTQILKNKRFRLARLNVWLGKWMKVAGKNVHFEDRTQNVH